LDTNGLEEEMKESEAEFKMKGELAAKKPPMRTTNSLKGKNLVIENDLKEDGYTRRMRREGRGRILSEVYHLGELVAKSVRNFQALISYLSYREIGCDYSIALQRIEQIFVMI
jgi:hypothetical protein